MAKPPKTPGRKLDVARKRILREADRLKRDGKLSQSDRLREAVQGVNAKNFAEQHPKATAFVSGIASGNYSLDRAANIAVKRTEAFLRNGDQQQREELLGDVLLSNNSIAAAFYAGTIDIWRDSEDREAAILEYYGKDNIYQVMELLAEETQLDLFDTDVDGDYYSKMSAAINVDVATRISLS